MARPTTFWRRLGRGLKRALGFKAATQARYYDAARPSRARDWSARAGGPNAVYQLSGQKLRDRSRDMVRNDPHIARAIAIDVANLVGSGITPRAVGGEDGTPEARRAAAANRVWAEWCRRGVADLEGQYTLDALVSLIVRSAKESGEVLVQRVFDRDAGLVPYRLRVLEAELLDEQKNEAARGPESNRIVAGVELSPVGRRVAYWIKRAHPAESWPGSPAMATESVRVPATDVIHFLIPVRPGQLRGLPAPSVVLGTKRDLSDITHFELVRRKVETAVAGFIIPGDDLEEDASTTEGAINPGAYDTDGNLVEDIQPGLLAILRGGKDIKFNTPQAAGGHVEQVKHLLHDVAVGLGQSYEQLTGDLSGANYSTLRAGLLEFWRRIDQEQWLYIIPGLMQTLWDWAMEGAYLTGALDTPRVPVRWSAPKRSSVDPSKDVLADVVEMRAGLAPYEDKAGERGYTSEELLSQLAAQNAAFDALGLVLDIDPRKMAFRGASPSTQAPADVATDTDPEDA